METPIGDGAGGAPTAVVDGAIVTIRDASTRRLEEADAQARLRESLLGAWGAFVGNAMGKVTQQRNTTCFVFVFTLPQLRFYKSCNSRVRRLDNTTSSFLAGPPEVVLSERSALSVSCAIAARVAIIASVKRDAFRSV